ncbi:MAG: arginine--tRNA ligase, partial [Rhodospirillales bacterium]|nr:arginine--tRNA ligase [Rhodospirillales bacterium]
MTDLYARLRTTVLTALRGIVPDLPEEVAARVEVSPARDPAHGDMATNAAMVSAKAARQPPAKIAAALVAFLNEVPEVAEAAAAGPGFVNIRLEPGAFRALLPAILQAGTAYGDSTRGNDQRVNVEYVSANPTGPMHIGHCRGAVVGDALANLLAKAGFDVTKEYYVNDAGAQVTALAWAAYWRYLQAIGTKLSEAEFAAEVPGGLQYRGDYLVPIGAGLAAQYGTSLAQPDGGIAAPELDALAAQGLIYEGVLEPPKGKTPDDWEPRPQTLFRSTSFGDDVDRPLRKSDGSNTYFANDIAYHADKVSRGFHALIDVWGADHGGYVKRMEAAVQAVSGGRTRLEVVLCQIVHVMRGGQPVRMSKRAGTYVTLRDLIDEVGRDAVRFTMLTRKADAQMEFDLDQAVAQTRDNPVFYVQYAHARCGSVLRAGGEMFGAAALAEAALAAVP